MIDILATLVLLFVVTVQTYTLFDKVMTTRADNVLTFDLRLPTWPFFLIAWLGDVSAVLLIAIRTYRLIFHPDYMVDPVVQKKSNRSNSDEHRRRRDHRSSRAVRADAAARAGGHGNGASSAYLASPISTAARRRSSSSVRPRCGRSPTIPSASFRCSC